MLCFFSQVSTCSGHFFKTVGNSFLFELGKLFGIGAELNMLLLVKIQKGGSILALQVPLSRRLKEFSWDRAVVDVFHLAF